MGSALALTACGTCGFPESSLAKIKHGMTPDQVTTLLGRPTRIDQSETADQTTSGEVDYYTAPNGEGRITYINHAVFKAEFIPGAKS